MMRAIAICGLLVSGCGPSAEERQAKEAQIQRANARHAEAKATAQREQKLIIEIKRRSVRDFLDPAAVQFRDLKYDGYFMICGEVNGKNGFGAYTGFTRFWATKATITFFSEIQSIDAKSVELGTAQPGRPSLTDGFNEIFTECMKKGRSIDNSPA